MRKAKWFVLAAVMCMVGLASAVFVQEPFDAFPAGGTNWVGNWTEGSPTLHTLTLSSDSPIKNGGSYLVYRTPTGTTVGANGLGRDFDTTIGEVIHTVRLNVRVDELGTFFDGPDISDRMQIYGDASNASADMGTYCTWCVMTTATVANNNWYVYDGIKTGKWSSSYLKDTGLPIVAGGIYSITVKVHPETLSYDLTMDNGTTTFTKLNNGFRAGPVVNPSDRIGFGNKVRLSTATPPGSDIQLSYDSIRVFANAAYAPTPANRATQVAVTSPVLSWNAGMAADPADPNAYDPVVNPAITGYYVYLSAANDPNLPTTPVFVTADADSNGQVDPVASYNPADLEVNGTYTWRIDTSLSASGPTDDPNLIKGTVYTFESETTDPIVEAGQNVVSYVDGGQATVNMAATVDWYNPQSTLAWTVESVPTGAPEGSIVISNPTVEDPVVTITYAGKPYVLKLTAVDNKGGSGEDTMQIDVYADNCEAAQNVSNYQPLAGDLNDDCQVNLSDLNTMAENWLDFNYLTANYLY